MNEKYKKILTNQTIDENGPGTILKDFDILLNFIQSKQVEVSKANGMFLPKTLESLNNVLTSPLQLSLKRPQQKSYPHIHGLYLLLRTTGLAHIQSDGKSTVLHLEERVLQSWSQLNPTERYFNLLEAWWIQANPEVIGESAGPLDAPFVACSMFLQQTMGKAKNLIVENTYLEDNLKYTAGLYNLALLERFGLIAVKRSEPGAGRNWPIAEIRRLDWSEALFAIINESPTPKLNFSQIVELILNEAEGDEKHFGDWQRQFKPYFPQLQKTLALPEMEFQEGLFIFKVSLGKAWRRIAIPATLTLEDLSDAILSAYEFDHDHLYNFTLKNWFGHKIEVFSPHTQERLTTDNYDIGALPIREGEKMEYLYDFGDNWEFDILLERIDPKNPKIKRAKILEQKGKAPEQYPSWDDE